MGLFAANKCCVIHGDWTVTVLSLGKIIADLEICFIFLNYNFPSFPKFQMYCQIYFSVLSEATLFLPSQCGNLSHFVIINYLQGK